MSEDGWIRRVFLMWHLSFAILVVVTVVSLLGYGAGGASYALLGLLCAAYAGLLVPSLIRQSFRLGTAYLGLAVPTVLALGFLDPEGLILLYALFPQLFGLLESRRIR